MNDEARTSRGAWIRTSYSSQTFAGGARLRREYLNSNKPQFVIRSDMMFARCWLVKAALLSSSLNVLQRYSLPAEVVETLWMFAVTD